MAKRKLPARSKRVKAIARKRIGTVAPSRPLDERAVRNKPKHKKQVPDDET